MRKVSFGMPISPSWNAWRIEADQATRDQQFEHGKKVNITDHYRDKRCKQEIARAFYGKCAFCESRILHVDVEERVEPQTQYSHVEHFRPKGRVRDRNDQVVRYNHNNEKYDHPGYYWLAYNWRNLTLACEICNSMCKSDRFPIEGNYMLDPEQDISKLDEYEKPLLINPIDDLYDPHEHFEFNRENGFLIALSEKAKMCNRIFQLNQRGLPEARMQVYIQTRLHFKMALDCRFTGHPDPFIESFIRRSREGKEPFTFAALWAIQDAESELLSGIRSIGTGSMH